MEKIVVPIVPLGEEDQIQEEIYIASALESEESNRFGFDNNDIPEDIMLILLGIGMEKYTHLFSQSKMTLQTFLALDESDLKELGITDTKDVEVIAENLRICNEQKKKKDTRQTTSEFNSIIQDLQIATNIKNELILLLNYCRYLELQMGRHKLIDYRINLKESASTYLKAFTETALLQARILSDRVFQDLEDKHLIGKILKLNNGTLPKELKQILQKKNPKRRIKIFSIAVFGILSLAVLIKAVVIKN